MSTPNIWGRWTYFDDYFSRKNHRKFFFMTPAKFGSSATAETHGNLDCSTWMGYHGVLDLFKLWFRCTSWTSMCNCHLNAFNSAFSDTSSILFIYFECSQWHRSKSVVISGWSVMASRVTTKAGFQMASKQEFGAWGNVIKFTQNIYIMYIYRITHMISLYCVQDFTVKC